VFREPQYEDSDAVVVSSDHQHSTERLPIRGLEHLFDVNKFMNTCLKFRHEMMVVTAPHNELLYEDIQKNAGSKITLFSNKSSISASAMQVVRSH
jgi:hypothetical protein